MATEVQPPVRLGYKDMIDVALGATDIGQFNLHLLHTILQCFVVQLNLDTATIEYSGTQEANIEHFLSNRASSIPKQTNIEKQDEVLLVTDHDVKECAVGTPGQMVERSIPKCKDLLDALKCKSTGNQNPLGQMVDMVNVSERMTAAEIAIEKLVSLIQDLLKKQHTMSDLLDEKNQSSAMDKLLERLDKIEDLNETICKQLEVEGVGGGGGSTHSMERGSSHSVAGSSKQASDRYQPSARRSQQSGLASKGGKPGADPNRSDRGSEREIASGDRPDKDKGDKEKGDKTKSDKDRGDTDKDDKGRGEKDRVDKDRPDTDKPDKERPDKDKTDKNKGDSNKIDGGKTDKDNQDKDGKDKGNKEKPDKSRDGPDKVKPEKELPDKDRTEKYTPDKDTPVKERPDKDRVENDRPDKDKLDKDRGDKDRSDQDKGNQARGDKQRPGKDKPDIERPDKNKSDPTKPDKERFDQDKSEKYPHDNTAIGDDDGDEINLTGQEDDGKDSDSIVEIYVRPDSDDLVQQFDQKKGDLFNEFMDKFKCSGGIMTGKQMRHLERELLRKLHLFKSMVFERLVAVECDLSRTQKQVKHINDNVEDLLDIFGELRKKIAHLDEFEKNTIDQFKMVQKNINCLMSEREVRRRQIYDLIEAIEMVKTIKANQEDLEALALQKADKTYADSKVSIKRFNTVQNDLACSVIQTMEKNTSQDLELEKSMKKVDCLLDGKIDRSEFNYRLAALAKTIEEITEKLNELIKLRVCPEGAGALQYMRNVRCITCNDVVSMKVEECHNLPRTEILKSKHQFSMQVETECRSSTVKRPKLTDILRSRYCGGQYTVVEPNERVPQKSDFYIDANVCPPPMSDVYYVKGNDGAFYRAAPPDGLNERVCESQIVKRKPSK